MLKLHPDGLVLIINIQNYLWK